VPAILSSPDRKSVDALLIGGGFNRNDMRPDELAFELLWRTVCLRVEPQNLAVQGCLQGRQSNDAT
jgi:hypothetical protein